MGKQHVKHIVTIRGSAMKILNNRIQHIRERDEGVKGRIRSRGGSGGVRRGGATGGDSRSERSSIGVCGDVVYQKLLLVIGEVVRGREEIGKREAAACRRWRPARKRGVYGCAAGEENERGGIGAITAGVRVEQRRGKNEEGCAALGLEEN
ncbi:hypothetical protein HAX54_022582 [Datura stramonium]|uniref:Uncharacterized protein n=1 Tax=Datura stramonium TaxID=4076 RepID=A0ABS8UWP1_DATST|nr:hypothetical protein [Datura stramonium]